MAWVGGGVRSRVVVGRIGRVVEVASGAVDVNAVDAALATCGVGVVGARIGHGAPVIACVSYDAGRGLEATAVAERSPIAGASAERADARRGVRDDRGWPGLVCAVLEEWRVVSAEEACAILLLGSAGFRVGEIRELRSDAARQRYERGVARVLEYIRAGDVYQVNLAHRLSADFHGDPRALMAALVREGRPRHGAYIEFADSDGRRQALASASPEMFLECAVGAGAGDPSRAVLRTRPMKGTRAIVSADKQGTKLASEHLAGSPKDRAELAMIVDLMRNDLGRVCELGSVRVEAPHKIERHGAGEVALLQATATVAGTPRAGLRWSEVLEAMFPGGSVTGAPKIRAMQIIDELEQARRGPYCGSVGVWMPDGSATFNVAIRTACISERASDQRGRADALLRFFRAKPHAPLGATPTATLDWWVGAGIVADSTPEGEWGETLAKASTLCGVMLPARENLASG
jgi:anthranilate/para-aminobenzoate synthase component I